ncbi:PEP-CTERM sorting domain-containing protein [Methylovorus mays]|uniref:PEP-CTERM sorting domain-containing protein n=1 Tax=Methylovorus mays TaxID=184077 RepID=UPI001E4CE915|nr:PEP-CTERM sorting domain-containing protein [Methylovorus mays]MCB5207737.1 PEP-CTERM sorting domain-containing protein [Methylovorus mays]
MPNPAGNLSGIIATTISNMDATLTNTFDVYVRIETYKAPVLTDASLHTGDGTSFAATSIVSYSNSNFGELEYYWLFSGVSAASTYTIKILNAGNLYNQVGITQLETFVVASAVPEPLTTTMMLFGIGYIGFKRRKSL